MSALTIEQLLALHPWPAEYAREKRVEWLWHFEVALSVEQLWPIISDSSRMNRALGVQEMKFEDRGNERWGSSAPLGIEQEWLEVPWNWLTGQWLESLRVYKRGFSKAVWGVFVLTPLEAKKTRVSVYFGAVPRNFFGKLINTLGFPTLEKDFVRVFKEVTEQLDALKPVFELPPAEPMTAAQEAKLVSLIADAPSLSWMVLTDDPADFQGTGAAAYHDKRFAIQHALEQHDSAVFLDADSRFTKAPVTPPLPQGIAVIPMVTNSVAGHHEERARERFLRSVVGRRPVSAGAGSVFGRRRRHRPGRGVGGLGSELHRPRHHFVVRGSRERRPQGRRLLTTAEPSTRRADWSAGGPAGSPGRGWPAPGFRRPRRGPTR